MNALQFETAKLEAQQRARTAIGAHAEAMMPPQAQPPAQPAGQASQAQQGAPNATTTQ